MLGSVLHRCRTELVTAGGLTLIGLPLGPLTMRPIYQQTSPALGGATLLVVEVLFALLIDFPLATTASVLVCGRRRSTKPTDGIRAALLALAVFFGAILVCLPIGNAVPGVGQLALQDVFPPAVSRAQALSAHRRSASWPCSSWPSTSPWEHSAGWLGTTSPT